MFIWNAVKLIFVRDLKSEVRKLLEKRRVSFVLRFPKGKQNLIRFLKDFIE